MKTANMLGLFFLIIALALMGMRALTYLSSRKTIDNQNQEALENVWMSITSNIFFAIAIACFVIGIAKGKKS